MSVIIAPEVGTTLGVEFAAPICMVQLDAVGSTSEKPTTLEGKTKVLPPVPSWQILNAIIWPATRVERVEEVTFPVKVILNNTLELLAGILKVGVAE
jgi:hypothetical protein